MRENRVVITGIGLITPNGKTLDDNFNALLKKNDCFEYHKFNKEDMQPFLGADIKPIDLKKEININIKQFRTASEYGHYAMFASKKAIEDSLLNKNNTDYESIGLYIGLEQEYREDNYLNDIAKSSITENNKYSFLYIPQKDTNKINVFNHFKNYSNFPLTHTSIFHKIKGPSLVLCHGSTSGGGALTEAFYQIKYSNNKIIIAGAIGLPFRRYKNSFYGKRGFISEKKRNVFANGAVFFVLEELEHAKYRNAKIYTEIFGAANCSYYSSDDYINLSKKGYETAIQSTLRASKLSIDNIDFITTSSFFYDFFHPGELSAIENITKENNIPLITYKTKAGFMMAAMQLYDIAMNTQVIKKSILPAMINIDHYNSSLIIKNNNLQYSFKKGLSISADFSGHYSGIIIGEYND